MDSLQLRVQKRSFPSHGRARVHTKALERLGIAEEEDLEVTPASGGKAVVVTAFADEMVDEEVIRLSTDDMKAIEVSEGDLVIATRRLPIQGQVRKVARETADQISRRAGEAGDSLKDAAAQARVEASQAADAMKEHASRVKTTVTGAAAGAAARIEDYNLSGRVNAAVEAAMKRLRPAESKRLLALLEKNEGAIRAATIVTDAAVDHRVSGVTLPAGVVLIAVQRNDTLLIPSPDTSLSMGDIAYLAGRETALADAIRLLEG